MINISNKTKNTLQFIFLFSLISITTYMVFNSLDLKLLSQVTEIIDYRYIFLGFILMAIYIILEGHIINLMIQTIHGTCSRSLGYKIGIIGLYYNLITPMASGSQPVQVYELSKHKVSTSKAIAVVVNKTILFQVVVTMYSGLLIFFNLSMLQNQLKSVFIFIIFGMIMNIVTLVFGFFIVFNPRLTKKLVSSLLNLLCKIKFLKFLEDKFEKMDLFIDEYNYSVRLFLKDKKVLAKSSLLTFIQLTIYFSIGYCISKALNLNDVSYVYLLSLQVFLYMAVSSMPTPGNVGANEIAFYAIFARVIPKELLGYSVFLYGVFVYYFLLIACGIFTIGSQVKLKDKVYISIKKLSASF